MLSSSGNELEAEKSFRSALAADTEVKPAFMRWLFQDVLGRVRSRTNARDNLALCHEAPHQDDLALKHYFKASDKASDLVYKHHPEYDCIQLAAEAPNAHAFPVISRAPFHSHPLE